MQGTQVRALVQEDPTCCGATKPVHHSYWACALDPASHNYWAHVPQLLKPVRLEPVLCNKRSHHNEKPAHHNKRVASGDFPGGPVVKTLPSNAGSTGSTQGRGAKIPHASQPKNQNIKQKKYCNKFNKDFKKKKKKSSLRSQQLEKTRVQQQRPNAAKN